MQMSARLGSLVALALGVGLEGVEVILPEPAVGSEVEVRRAVWGKLVAEGGNCLGMGYRSRRTWVGRLDYIMWVLTGTATPKVLTTQCG